MKKNTVKTILTGILVVIAFVVKLYNDSKGPASSENQRVTDVGQLKSSEDEKRGKYFVLKNCVYVPDTKYNDGDSFKVKTEDGRIVEVRCYFVDTAESKDKPYADHRKRVTDQGRYFGDLGYKEALKLGREAKKYAERSLSGKKLTVYTIWEEVYTSGRYYAFVEVPGMGLWHEDLVKKGLARIHTKGADLPNGTRWKAQKERLKNFEKKARASGQGGWGY